jgi:SnoaL-like domain
MGDNSEAIARYREAVESGDMVTMAAVLDDFATDDFVQEWPQSGERLNLEGSKRMFEHYADATGTSPKMDLRGIRTSGDLVVVEGTIDYGNGVPVSYVGIGEFRDGKVTGVTEYFADPFEAPAWRAPFVEKA